MNEHQQYAIFLISFGDEVFSTCALDVADRAEADQLYSMFNIGQENRNCILMQFGTKRNALAIQGETPWKFFELDPRTQKFVEHVSQPEKTAGRLFWYSPYTMTFYEPVQGGGRRPVVMASMSKWIGCLGKDTQM